MSFWSDEKVTLLKRLYVEDGMSCAQIRERLGAPSRSSVLGKVHRLGLKQAAASKPKAKPARERTSFNAPFMPHAKRITPVSERAPGLDRVVSLRPAGAVTAFGDAQSLELAHGCKWPIGDGDSMMFCNAPRADHRYCATHKALSAGRAPTKNFERSALRLAKRFG